MTESMPDITVLCNERVDTGRNGTEQDQLRG